MSIGRKKGGGGGVSLGRLRTIDARCVAGGVALIVRKERVSRDNNVLPQVTYRAVLWGVLPITVAFALYQCATVLQLMPPETAWPKYTLLTIAAAPVCALVALRVTAVKRRRVGIYRMDWQTDPMGMTFTLQPSQQQAPIGLLDGSQQTAVSLGAGQWRLTWAKPPRRLRIQTHDRVTFHL